MERTHGEEFHRRINHVLRTRTCVQMECSEDGVRIKSTRAQNNWLLRKQLENHNRFGGYFEEHAKEVWNRNWMNPEMQTTLLNT